MKTAEDLVRKKGGETVSVPIGTTIHEALKVIVDAGVGAVLVTDDGKYVGIWSERDLMRNTITAGFDPATAKIEDYMVTGLRSAPHSDAIYNLMDKMLGLRMRHLLIEKEGEYIGLLSVGDVMKVCLTEKTQEFEKLNHAVSWEYYEEWKW